MVRAAIATPQGWCFATEQCAGAIASDNVQLRAAMANQVALSSAKLPALLLLFFRPWPVEVSAFAIHHNRRGHLLCEEFASRGNSVKLQGKLLPQTLL